MPNMAGKVCLNHANVPAVSRCETCSKPLCEDCILEVQGSHFCCERCAGDGIDKRERIVLNSANQGSKASTLMTKVVILIILAGLACAGYVYWRNNQVKMGKLKEEAPKTLQNADSRRQQ